MKMDWTTIFKMDIQTNSWREACESGDTTVKHPKLRWRVWVTLAKEQIQVAMN
jgi:hypothetical protein